MNTLKRNETSLYYSLYEGNEYVEIDGLKTGERTVRYSEPVEMEANISGSKGEAQIEQFGTALSYDKVIVTAKTDCPIDENSVLFVDRKSQEDLDAMNYDYVVKKVAKTINSISYAIAKVESHG